MVPTSLYRILVPDALPHRRTDRDVYSSRRFETRARAAPFLIEHPVQPGIQTPSLIPSAQGAIETLLFAFPAYGVTDARYAAAYQSVIQAFRPGTKFVVVHHRSLLTEVAAWFTAAGHPAANITYVPLPDYVSFTDWAEDAYVALRDAADGSTYLMEPWEFPRAGDALIAESVQDHALLMASQAPLIFQGGNCLIGDDFWLLGKDYLPTVSTPATEPAACHRPWRNKPRRLCPYVVCRLRRRPPKAGSRRTRKPISVQHSMELVPTTSTSWTSRQIVGAYQPIFHIDMFTTLVGRDNTGAFEVLVGSPALADELLGTRSPVSLSDVYDSIAGDLATAGMKVHRNPLVHRPTVGRAITLVELRRLANQPGNEALIDAVDELVAAGATDSTSVRVQAGIMSPGTTAGREQSVDGPSRLSPNVWPSSGY